MPDIELIPVPLYQPAQPYNHQIDNLPISALIERILLVNSQVDMDAEVLRTSIGSVGSLAARLAASLNDDGSLKTSAVNDANHSIAYHTDGSIIISGVPYSYVRMTYDERSKLDGIDSGATDLTIKVDVSGGVPSDISNISQVNVDEVVFSGGQLHLKASDAISWRIDDEGAILADTTFPAAARHRHYYDVSPTHQDTLSPDYTNYKVVYAYKEGSLRVYINGIRLSKTDETYVPNSFTAAGPSWDGYSYSEGVASGGSVTSGKFSLSAAITSSDVIRVDFDALYT